MDLMSLIKCGAEGNQLFIVSGADLMSFGEQLINRTVVKVMADLRNETYDASDVMKLLHIGRSTLSLWEKKGKLKPAGKSGNKNTYSKREIDELVEASMLKNSDSAYLMQLRTERKKILGE